MTIADAILIYIGNSIDLQNSSKQNQSEANYTRHGKQNLTSHNSLFLLVTLFVHPMTVQTFCHSVNFSIHSWHCTTMKFLREIVLVK
jgi:hypothetical protein